MRILVIEDELNIVEYLKKSLEAEGFHVDTATDGNIGLEKEVVENINCSHKIFHKIVDELRKEYSVRDILCGGSGCCQYATYGYYLD